MKRLTALLLAVCCLLSACAKGVVSDDPPPDSGVPGENHGETGGALPDDSTPEEPSPEYVPPDYSAHGETYADEEIYVTELADLGRLSSGGQALVWEVGPADWSGRGWDGEDAAIWGYDMRSCDVSGEDLRDIADWNGISFNSDTRWPDPEKLPEGFDPEAVLELGKDPGLGIRDLHDRGITGEGVGIAIIDQGLYTGHEEYRDNLALYECLHASDGRDASLHGSAVSSIAVGRDVGVAPGASLYYIACDFGHYTGDGYEYDLSILADGVYRVLEINRDLPEDAKIRVISISLGASPAMAGFPELEEAVRAAGKEGILVLTVSPDHFYPSFRFLGMSRKGLTGPNDPQSYGPAPWLADQQPVELSGTVLVPMGGRTYAGCTGEAAYEWNYEGGMSWAVPWLAGFYALCCQAVPGCTADQFFKAVQDTASVELYHENGLGTFCFGKIIDPAAAIEALKGQ